MKMTVSLFDILSKIIPGGLMFFVISHALNFKTELNEIIVLILVYILGFFIEAIASLIERPVIFRLFRGNPAERLLNGKKYMDIKISRLEKLNEIVNSKFNKYKEDKLRLFLIFHSIVSKKDFKRVNHFMEQYILSRNMLVSCFLSGILFLIFQFGWIQLVISVFLLILIFIRSKQRNYYFVKEVINSFLYQELNKEEKKTDANQA